MSRWSKWVSDEPRGFFSTFVNEAEQFDQGNPTPQHLNGQSPGEKAKQMGLQSDGHGGYRDPNTGQLVARTVNGELVFYDGGPGGGAVSDGAGGDKLATAQPSWQDPVSGMMLTPPSKPETPEEIAAIPDATPATPPFGYEKFMQQKKMAAYQEREQQPEQGPEGDMDLGGMMENMDNSRVPPEHRDDAEDKRLVARQRIAQRVATTSQARKGNVDPGTLSKVISQQPSQQITTRDMMDRQSRISGVDPMQGKSLPSNPNSKAFDAHLAKAKAAIQATYDDSEKELGPEEAARQRALARHGQPGRLSDEEEADDSDLLPNGGQPGKGEIKKGETGQTINNPSQGGSPGSFDSETAGTESGHLYALQQILSNGALPGDVDLTQTLSDMYGQNDNKVRSAIKTAQAIADKLGLSTGEMMEDVKFGRFGGQYSDIPEDQRSNLYDSIEDEMYLAAGRAALKGQTGPRGRDFTEDEIRKEGRKMIGNEVGSTGGGLKDNFQTGDIYFSKGDAEEEIMDNVRQITESFGGDPRLLMGMMQHYLINEHNARRLNAVSLKELSPGSEDISLKEYNTDIDDYARITDVIRRKPNSLSFNFGSQGGKNSEFDMPTNSWRFEGDLQGEDDKGDVNLPFQWESRRAGSGLKIEPNEMTPRTRGKESKKGEMIRKTGHLGMVSQNIMKNVVNQYTGNDMEHMIPPIGENFTPEMIDFHQKRLEELDLDESDITEMDREDFKLGGKNMKPGEWISSSLQSMNSDLSDEDFANQYGAPRTEKSQQAIRNTLRQIAVMHAMKNSNDQGEYPMTIGKLLMGAGKIRNSPDDIYLPRFQAS